LALIPVKKKINSKISAFICRLNFISTGFFY
jgi:hypothetical protein